MSAIRGDEPRTHKLWGARFATASATEFDALNHSLSVDFRLWPHDVRASKAWAVALWNAGVLTLEESDRIANGLDAVALRLAERVSVLPSDEDVHTLIDRLLHDEVGDVAAKLHTGRSRNDQVATATRLWTMDACRSVDAAIRSLQHVLLQRAEEHADALMPGYTHLQRAQPVSVGHWLLAHFWPLERDRARFTAAHHAAGVLPLGCGALAGSGFPVCRALLQGTLGFGARATNSIDAVSDRDFIAETLFALALLCTHLSRLAEDLIIYGTSEFGFVRFGDAFSSGSSMMPQKRNPDALELARASAGRRIGELTSMLAIMKGLPSGYNKDLQEDKSLLFAAVDATLLVLPAVTGSVRDLVLNTERMESAIDASMMATDLADHMVARGATFREAHQTVGGLARLAETGGVSLADLGAHTIASAHPALGDGAIEALSARSSVARRESDGGTGPGALQAQIAAAHQALHG